VRDVAQELVKASTEGREVSGAENGERLDDLTQMVILRAFVESEDL
jgi:hypothetical protein